MKLLRSRNKFFYFSNKVLDSNILNLRLLGTILAGMIVLPHTGAARSTLQIEEQNNRIKQSCTGSDRRYVPARSETSDEKTDVLVYECITENNSGNSSSTITREYNKDSECNYANQFDIHNGRKCAAAEKTIKDVAGRNKAAMELNQAGAAVIQLSNTMQTPRTQEDAFKQTQFNMKAAILTSVAETGNNIYSASQLSQAEADAQSAARGIRSVQQTYTEAENEAKLAAGKQGGNFVARLNDTRSVDDIKKQIDKDQGKKLLSGNFRDTDNPIVTQRNQEINAAIEQEKKAADKFGEKIAGTGLDETAKNFNSFEQMRSSTRRGIQEAKDVAEQAERAASSAKIQALGSAMQTAQAIAAYRATQNQQQNLGSLGPTIAPRFALDASGNPTAAPVPPGGSSANIPIASDLDIGDGLAAAGPRRPMHGSFEKFNPLPGTPFKGKVASVSSGGGKGGGGGGGGGSSGKGDNRRANIPANSYDYDFGSGGGRLNQFGAGGAGAGASDLQDAVKSMLAGSDPNAENARTQEFRNLASMEDGQQNQAYNDSAATEDLRTIFERVKEKYNDVVNKGVI